MNAMLKKNEAAIFLSSDKRGIIRSVSFRADGNTILGKGHFRYQGSCI